MLLCLQSTRSGQCLLRCPIAPMNFHILIIIFLFSSGCAVKQPPFMVVEKGKPGMLNCSQLRTNYLSKSWYKQGRGNDRQFQLLVFSTDERDTEVLQKFRKHFSSTRTKNEALSLQLKSARLEDTGTYFCAEQGTVSEVYFGKGTRLTVVESEKDITPPNVTIFAPSTQELREKKKITIVCLVTNFYPDHVNLTWYLDGDVRTEGTKTEEPDFDEAAKKFSLISRLRITRNEWEKTKEFKCNVYFDPKNNNYFETISGQTCHGSDTVKESYHRSTNLGKLIYILLIFKSALYGAFVTGLMLRKKSMKEKLFA